MNAAIRQQLRLRVDEGRREQLHTQTATARKAKADYLERNPPRTPRVRPPSPVPLVRACAYCERTFKPAVHNQRYCSRIHQERAYRRTPHGRMLELRRKRAQRARLRQMAL